MTINNFSRKPLLICTAFLAAVSSAPAWSEDDRPSYTVMFVEDGAAGSDIVKGSFETAIQKLSTMKMDKRDNFTINTNICVAYLKSSELEKASEACDTALAAVEAEMEAIATKRSSNRANRYKVQSNLAMALSNKGVLYAIAGETDRAKQAFARASQFRTHQRQVRENIARINYETNTQGGSDTKA